MSLAPVRRILAYPAAQLRAIARDRTSLFFLFLLPAAIIVVVGFTFGGENHLEIGIVRETHGTVSDDLFERLSRESTLRIHPYADPSALETAVRRGEVNVGVVIPQAIDRPIPAGTTVRLPLWSRPGNSQGLAASVALQGALAPLNAQVTAAQVLVGSGETWSSAVDASVAAARDVGSGVREEVRSHGATTTPGRFSQTVTQNLVLFIFTNALAGSAFLVAVRRNGMLQRSLSTAASHGEILTGLWLSILTVAVVQSAVIVVMGSLVFRVSWGDPASAVALVAVSDLAAAAGGLFVGTLAHDADRAGALAPIVGIVAGVLGGCIVPLEIFPPALVAAAHAVPQYWAVEGWTRLIFDGGGLGDVAPNLVVLAGFAAALVAGSVVLLRRELSTTR